jgi:PAS domain S-box-containing protein
MAWWRPQRLRTRLSWLVLLTLAPAIVLHVASALEKRRMALSSARDNLKSITDLAAGNAQTVLESAGEVLHGLTKLPAIAGLRPAEAEQALTQAKSVFPHFACITLLRPDGSILASSIPGQSDVNYADRPWVRQALTDKSLAIGGYKTGKRSGLPGIALARPILDASDAVVGVCMLSLRLTWFTRIFDENRMPGAAEACLFDDRGVILAAWPDSPQSLGTALPDATQVLASLGSAPEKAWTGPGPDGAPYYYVVSTVSDNSPNRLHARLGLPARAVSDPLDAAMLWDMGVLALVLALALVAAHLFSRIFVLRPAQQLARMAQAMAGGDLDKRSGMTDGHGEMADLGRALDAMADNLRERIRFTQELIDAIPAPLFYKGMDGRYLGCNTIYERDIHPLATILGKTPNEIESPAAASLCVAADHEVRKAPGRTLEYEAQVPFQDGSVHDMVIFKSLFNNASGAPAGIVGVGLDITARKRFERALLASQARYRALLASMRDGFVVADRQNRIVDSNPAFRDMLGYSAKELAHLTYRDFTPEIWHEVEETILRTAVDVHGFSDVFEKEYRRKDGSIFPVALRLHRYPSQAGDDCRYFAIVRDITEVKNIEAALRYAKETAETANRAKSDFLAKMSHEIRTPLHAVIGMTELTLDTDLSPQQRDALETVRESAGSLLAIINDILDLSRIEARRLELARENFDLRRILAATVRTMRPQASQKGLILSLSIAPTTPRFVLGDPMRLRQILINLIGNALKFTEQGRVTVRVRPVPGQAGPPGGTWLEFVVTDTGVGIPADRLDRIFEMFTQADHTVSSQYGGTGLGLAICLELARLMNGSIAAESALGQGSIFRVTIQLAGGVAPKRLEPATAPTFDTLPQAAEAIVPAGAPASLRILLAEDNTINVKVATTYLARRGLTPVVAENGRQALERLSSQSFDLVLMDVEMPELDGLEATRRLRSGQAGPANRHIPVVAMTAHALNDARERCLAAGMTDYLPKPLDFQALDAILAQAAHSSETAAPQSAPTGSSLDLDTERALLRLGGDAVLLQEIQIEFLRQYPGKLLHIGQCSANKNWSEAALAAHSLKNIAGAVGAEQSRILAGRLEEQLRRADVAASHTTLAALEKSLTQADAAMKAHPVPAE